MRSVIVRYTVKPDQAAANEELVRAVYEELAVTKPVGFRYATFRLEDGVGFVHLARYDTDENPLQESEAFMRFQESIHERCVVPPVATSVHEVGSYNLFGESV